MGFTVTAKIDQGRAAEQIRKRSAKKIEERGVRIGVDAVKTTKNLIDREMGEGDGSSQRRGLTRMRDMPFDASVDSGGDFPIVVSLHNTVSGPSAGKFAAIEYGYGEFDASPGKRLKFPDKETGKMVVPRTTIYKHPGQAGHFFMRRGLGIAVAGVYAGFQYTSSFPHAR
jgi:hypothetical protein